MISDMLSKHVGAVKASQELYVLPEDDKRYAIETCRRSENVLKWFKVNNFRLIHNTQLVHLLVMWHLVDVSTSFGLLSTQERLHEVPQLRPQEVICHVGSTATATGWSPVGDRVESLLTSMNDTLHTLFNKHDRQLRHDAVWVRTHPYGATSQKTITSTLINLRYSVLFRNFCTYKSVFDISNI